MIFQCNKTDLVVGEITKDEKDCIYISSKNKEGIERTVDLKPPKSC